MPIYRKQFDTDHLVKYAVENKEGHLNKHGVFCTYTGPHTGRSPDAKRIVKDSITIDAVDWNNNTSMIQSEFDELEKKFNFYMQYQECFSQEVYAVRDEMFRLPIQVITKYAKHSLFARNMFIPADKESFQGSFKADWTVINIPEITNKPSVVMSFEKKLILISGTLYAGEIKKSIFTVLNFDFLDHGLPMHCSVNVDKSRKNPAIFFGLSGTGKTTLSADESRILIGDDEHGWSDSGLTNFEGGCYAKTINLSKTAEPQIWKAAHTPGSMLENVVVDDTGAVDFTDTKYTENSRCSYPTSFIDGADEDGYVVEQPKNVIMLTCDAFGVLPAVMKLSSSEAVKQFLMGYTAKVAGTEKGVTEPKATFSPCFGLPFMPKNPKLYGRKLQELVEKNNVNCWLVNTGWTGGPYGIGDRMPISVTRYIISLILDGSLASCKSQLHKPTGFTVPLHAAIDQKYIFPEKSWGSIDAYNKKLKILLEKFAEQGQ